MAGQTEGPTVSGEEIADLLSHREWDLDGCQNKIIGKFDVFILILIISNIFNGPNSKTTEATGIYWIVMF